MKKILSILLLVALMVSLVACTGDTNPNTQATGNTGTSGGTTDGVENPIKVDPLDLGDGFDADYYPVKEQIQQREGKIDVVILFDGSNAGWQAMADEYMRLHGGSVYVNLNTDYSSGTYADALTYEITNTKTDWDIVQGNIAGSLIEQYGINMYTYVNGTNAYAGNEVWNTVIEQDAYITDKSGTNTSTYIMNSENLLTAWFVNTVALEAAGAQGYKNANGEVGNPVTWDDLISLCEHMVKAGYKNPLGVSLNKDAITSYNFSWLLRVYGDYYFRNENDGIMNDGTNFQYDPTSENPENDINYAIDVTKLFHKILDSSDTEEYVGPNSAKYKEFVTNISKIRPYLDTVNGSQSTMEDLRNIFQTQSKGKDSPQIVLDYSGTGLYFLNNETADYKVDFFDYPEMVSAGGYVPEGTITRDVGGNGGYLSIIDHDSAQNELNLDFMKFVMSPYGQSIYYDALSKTNFAPKGLTLVCQDLVKIPEKWTTFFATDKISFTGLADTNEFVRNMVVSIGGQSVADDKVKFYQNLLIGVGQDQIDVDTFCNNWASTLMRGWAAYAKANNWNENCYKYPGNGTSYGG